MASKADDKKTKKEKKVAENEINAPAEIKKTVEQIAEDVVMISPSDYKGLADLHTQVETIVTWAGNSEVEILLTVATKISQLIEGIILEESSTVDADFEVIGEAIAGFQNLICEGRDLESITWPVAIVGESAAEEVKDSGYVLPPTVDQEIFEEFLERQTGLMDDMEEYILTLEKKANKSALAELRRMLHTLKGESALLALNDIEHLCHTTEGALNRENPKKFADLLLTVKDWFVKKFECLADKGEEPDPVDDLIESLEAIGEDEDKPKKAKSSKEPAKKPAAKAKETQAEPEPEEESEEEVEPEPEPAPVAKPKPAPVVKKAAPIEKFVPEEIPLEGDLDLLSDFVAEAREHLDNADVHLLTLETEPQENEALNAVFRAFHTIKGVAGFLMLNEMGGLAHEAENLLDQARKGDLILEGAAIDVTFESVDTLKHLVDSLGEALATGTRLMTNPAVPGLKRRIVAVAAGEELEREETDFEIDPGKRIGEILVETGTAAEDDVNEALERQKSGPPPKKVGQILTEHSETTTLRLNRALSIQDENPDQMLGEILVEEGYVSRDGLDHALELQKMPPRHEKIGELLVREGKADAREVAKVIRGQQLQKTVKLKETVKVDADRLDRLLDLIGELVIAESMVTQSSELQGNMSSNLSRQVRHLDKITRELQEMSTSLRMVPVKPIFQKMARLARDLSKKSGKPINFDLQGEDTELDKTVVDKIGDPLVHMVRNAIDHGIESSTEERVKRGKSPEGNVKLRAFHKGGSIYIEIQDDGKGLNKEAILAKAVSRGIINENDQLSDKEIFNLIFEPGFSTAKMVTDVSGRGVGMDVVRKNIELLRGQVEIRSEEGQGSTFTLRLPLTLAIIDGMIVKVGDERFIIPTLSIVRSIQPTSDDLNTVLGKGEMLKVQGELLPLFRLSRLFNISDSIDDATQALVVVVEDDGMHTGILVDKLLGQQQIVIKSLGESLKNVDGVAGGAIMPDGRVGLIIDVGGIVKVAHGGKGKASAELEEV